MARVKFIKDEEPNIKALSSDKVLDGAIYVATDTGNMFLGMSDGTLLSIGGSDSIDTNTTYTLTKSGSNITLTGSDGSTYTVSDDNTTYTLDQDMGSLACSIYLYGPGYSSTKAKIPVMQGATSSSVGEIGLVPEQPINPYPERVFLNSYGMWVNPVNTIGFATLSRDGFMSTLDKEKLDGIEEGANAYVLPQATSSVLGGVKVGSNLTVSSGVLSVSKDNVTSALGYTPPTTNTTYSAGTGISLSGTTFSNSGVRSVATGSSNGTISVNTNGATANVAVKGLGSAAYTESSAYAASSHDHNRVASKGTHAEAASGSTGNAPTTGMVDTTAGMYMTQSYADSNAPATYGNIINMVGAGTGQLMAEWSGSDSTTGHLYYRSHRDTSTGGWGSWNTIIDSANIGSQSVNYANAAGSATSATTATKLSSSAGSATSPIYFSNGKPVACTYSLNKTVPSNAVFTDTTDTVVVSSTQPTSSTCKLWIIP